jgi:diaminopimelate decarboxylase
VGTINAESAGELDRIAARARAAGRVARVALRVNPDIDAQSHPNISTGLRSNKFGVALQDARTVYRERRGEENLRFVGVHIHHRFPDHDSGTAAARRGGAGVTRLELRDDGVPLEHVDLGGGLGIAYEGRR